MRMLARLAYPRRCVCFDCGDPSRNKTHRRLRVRSDKRREARDWKRFDVNYTYNCAPMFETAGCPIRELHGMAAY